MRRLHEQFRDELVIIGVHSAKFPSEKLTDNIREAVLRHDIRHPVVNDAGFEIWNQYGVRAWPTVVLIDPAGNLIAIQPGEVEAEAFTLVIQELISEFDQTGELDRRPLDLRPEMLSEPARPLNYPSKLLLSSDGRLFVADTGHHRILEVQLKANNVGEIIRVFGAGKPGLKDGSAAEAMFQNPHGMALDGDALYVADTDNHTIRAIDLESGMVRTVAGTGEKGRGLLGGSPTEIPLRSPWALWAEDSVLFIAMAGSHQIWGLVDEERLGIFAGDGREALVDGPTDRASFNQPSDLALGMGHLFIADSEASAIRVISLDTEPRVMTLIGQGLFEFGDVDGVGGEVRLQHPTGLAFADGMVYIADSYNHKIKRLDPTTGHVETLVGTGQPGLAGGSFSQGELFEPEGVALHDSKLYIADTNNHLVRIADLEAGMLHTLSLEGLQRLSVSMADDYQIHELEPVMVTSGQVTLTFDIAAPPGHKLNPSAPITLREVKGETLHVFDPGEIPALVIAANTDREVLVDLTLYYCEAEDERLCMIHDARLLIPLKIAEDSSPEIPIHYEITPKIKNQS